MNPNFASLFEKVAHSPLGAYEKVAGLHKFIQDNFQPLDAESVATEATYLKEYHQKCEDASDAITDEIVADCQDNQQIIAGVPGPSMNLLEEKHHIKLYIDNGMQIGAAIWEDYVGLYDPDYEWGQSVVLFQVEGKRATDIAYCSNAIEDAKDYETIFSEKLNEKGMDDVIDAIQRRYTIG